MVPKCMVLYEYKSLAIFLEGKGFSTNKSYSTRACLLQLHSALLAVHLTLFPDWVVEIPVLQRSFAHQVVNNRIIALFHGPVDRLYKRSANKEVFLRCCAAFYSRTSDKCGNCGHAMHWILSLIKHCSVLHGLLNDTFSFWEGPLALAYEPH